MILLTGASGYLGQCVSAILAARNISYEATSYTGSAGVMCDLTQTGEVAGLLARIQADVIIHCAANVPKTPEGYQNIETAADSFRMARNMAVYAACPVVFASSWTVNSPSDSPYASSKWLSEALFYRFGSGDLALRIPGLFGLPRRSGVIYDAAKTGIIPDSFGPYPSMHVADAAEYLVRAATMPSDGNREPFSVTYGDPRLEACYGSLGVTFDQRVRELVEELRCVPS